MRSFGSARATTFVLFAALSCNNNSVTLLIINSNNGAVLQSIQMADPTVQGVVSLASVGDVVYFTLGNNVHALNVTSGGVATLYTGDHNIEFIRVDSDGSLVVNLNPITLLVPGKGVHERERLL